MATRVLPQRPSGMASVCAPVLQALEDGRLIRKLVAAFMRIGGAVALLGMLALAFGISMSAFKAEGALQSIAMLILALMLVLFGAASFLVQLYRAASVDSLGDSPFTVIPIVSICFRLFGEVYGLFLITLGLGSCLFIWLTGNSPSEILGPLGSMLVGREFGFFGNALVSGLLTLIAGFFMGFVVLLAAYLLAEYVAVIPDIARNVRVIVAMKKEVPNQAR